MTTPLKSADLTASTSGKVASGLLLAVVSFQLALAAGAPWGAAAQGGAHPGVLPDEFRVGSAIGAVLYLLLALAAAAPRLSSRVRRPVMYGGAGLMGVGFILNIASPSLIERILWAPVTVALILAFWHAARADRSATRGKSEITA